MDYDPPTHCTDAPGWINGSSIANATADALPEGRTPIDTYSMQELRATQAEIAASFADRLPLNAVVATERGLNITPAAPGLPMAWTLRDEQDRLSYSATLQPGEHHVFQISFAALELPFEVLGYSCGVPAGWNLTCHNLEGVDAWGRPWAPANLPYVAVNHTLPLWFSEKGEGIGWTFCVLHPEDFFTNLPTPVPQQPSARRWMRRLAPTTCQSSCRMRPR